jgi:hypothetical protein
MRRLGFALALTMAATAALAGGTTFNVRGDDCTSANFNWDGEDAFVARETINPGALRSLKASVDHAPISVTGGAPAYSIEVCKAAARAEDLSAIRVTVDGGELRATGPDNRRWFVRYKVRVPDGASIDVEANNGPMSISDVNGTVVARTSNGPLSLRNVGGNVDASTTNGPISLRGGSGNVKVQAQNGPLSIDLDGTSWLNGSLDGSTRNGPLSVSVPRNYGSGVTVETNGRGPVSCRAEGCERYRTADTDTDGRRHGHWNDQPRRIELGSGSEAVRLSTTNGPVTIKDE